MDRMQQCGVDDDAAITYEVKEDFCRCLQCTFVPAAESTEDPYEYLDAQTCAGVPTFEDAVLQLADNVCGSREPTGKCHASASSPLPLASSSVMSMLMLLATVGAAMGV